MNIIKHLDYKFFPEVTKFLPRGPPFIINLYYKKNYWNKSILILPGGGPLPGG